MTPDNEVQPTSVPRTGVPPKTCEHGETAFHSHLVRVPIGSWFFVTETHWCSGPKQVALEDE